MNAEPYAVIISAASDLNRGDQALLWQAKQVIDDALGIKKYYVFGIDNENLKQSENEGFETLEPILHHPSYHIKAKSSIRYTPGTLVKWGSVACLDFIRCMLILHGGSKFADLLLSGEQKRTFDLLANADIVAVKGGGFIHAYGAVTDPYYIFYSLFHARLAAKLGRKVVILPNSFGPFKGPGIATQVRNALNKCSLVTTRESISTQALSEIGVSKALQFPDMAFLLEKDGCELVERLANEYSLNEGDNKIAITVRPYRFPELENGQQAYTNYVDAFAKFSDWLVQEGYRVFFVVQTYSFKNTHENDYECVKHVMERMKEKAECIHSEALDCRSIKALYAKFNLLVGTRFHSVIFSVSEGVPSIALSYSGNKTTGIMKDMGLDAYVLNAGSISFDDLKEKFTLLLDNREQYSLTVDTYRKAALVEYERLKDCIRALIK